jgi:hypothetical protein
MRMRLLLGGCGTLRILCGRGTGEAFFAAPSKKLSMSDPRTWIIDCYTRKPSRSPRSLASGEYYIIALTPLNCV